MVAERVELITTSKFTGDIERISADNSPPREFSSNNYTEEKSAFE